MIQKKHKVVTWDVYDLGAIYLLFSLKRLIEPKNEF